MQDLPPVQPLSAQPHPPFLRRFRRHWPEIIAVSSLVLAVMYCAGGVFLTTAATKWVIYPLYAVYGHISRFIDTTQDWVFSHSPEFIFAGFIGLTLLALFLHFGHIAGMLAALLFAGFIMVFGSFATMFRTLDWPDSAHVGSHIYRVSHYDSLETSRTTLYECDRFGIFCHDIFMDDTMLSSQDVSLLTDAESGTVSLLAGDRVLFTTAEE